MANSAAIIGAPTVSDVTEDTNLQVLIAAGLISITDANAGQAAFKTTVISASGNLGSLTITANGAYSYSVADSAVQYLGTGDTKIDTFTVTSVDGTTKKVSFTIHGVNDTAVIGTAITHDVTEDATRPNLTATGSISISDVDQGEASFKTSVISSGGNLGTLTLGTNGSYSYSVANNAVQYLGAGDTKVDTFTVTSNDGTTKQISFTIHGVNDAAVIGTPTVHDVTEDATNPLLTANGMISITDADQGQAAFKTSVISASGNLGNLTIAANGSYGYSVADSAVRYLGAGDTKVDTFTVTSLDGTTKQVSFTIHGVNDAAVIGTPTVHDVTEDATQPLLYALGTISISDADQGEAAFQLGIISGAGALGTLILLPNGAYAYFVSDSAVQYLGANDVKVDTFTVTAVDGTTKQISFTIHGTNDVAAIGAPTVHDVTEDSNPATLTATGSIAISDADQGQAAFQATVVSAASNLGMLTLAANGSYNYTVANSATQYLGASDTKTDTFTIASVDGTTKQVTFTIHGVNDAAVIGTPTVHDVTADPSLVTLTANGSISISDADQGQAFFKLAVTSASSNLGHLTLASNGSYSYTVAESAAAQLGTGGTKVDTFTVTSLDGTTKQITFTVHGASATSHAATIGDPTIHDVTEDTSINAGNLTAIGSISISDPDAGQAAFLSASGATGNLGSLVLSSNGNYTYTVANSAVQNLGAADTKVDTFTVTSVDNTTKQVSFTIHGSNDAAVIGDPLVHDVTEDAALNSAANLTATGTLTIADPDQNQNTFQTTVTGPASNLGSLSITSTGAYTYAVANSATQSLGANDTKVDTFTVTALDGTPKQVSFTIHGANDAAVIGGVHTGDATEDATVVGGKISATGVLTVQDVDQGQAHFAIQTTAAGAHGTFALDANGNWSYAADDSQAAIQQLGDGQTLTDSFTAVSQDGSASQVVTVTIHGTDDAPIASPVTLSAGTEGASYVITQAALLSGVTDIDSTSLSITSLTVSSGGGSLHDNGDHSWTYTPDTYHNGQISFDYTVSDGSLSASSTAGFILAAVATQPVVTTARATAYVGQDIALNITVADPDASDTLASTITISGVPNGEYKLNLGSPNDDGIWTVNRSDLSGLKLQYVGSALQIPETITLHVSATSTDGASTALTARDLNVQISDPAKFYAVDGYISDALVFIDKAGTGSFVAGDPFAYTAGDGSFSLDTSGGPVILQGVHDGVHDSRDVLTGFAFNGILKAPTGSTVVTPLTTLIVAVAGTGGDVAAAESTVKASLGLSGDVDLKTLDPVAGTLSNAPGAAAVLAASIQVQATVTQLSAATGVSADDVVSKLATQVSGGNVDLGDSLTIGALASAVNPSLTSTDLTAISLVVSGSNTSISSGISSSTDLTGVAQASQVAFGSTTQALTDAQTSGTGFDQVATDYTGVALAAKIAAAPLTITGTAASDVLVGGAGDDSLSGLGGNDILTGGAGDDHLDGGAGSDRAIYSDATGGVTIDLTAGTASGAGVGSDTLTSIEAVTGSDFADTFSAVGFTGSSGIAGRPSGLDDFEGKGGDDIIHGTVNASGQILTRISYVSAAAAVTVDIAAGTAHGTAAGDAANVGNDTFTNVNAVIGSAYDDTLLGSNNPNASYEQYDGRAGNDFIDGRGGYDFAVYNNDATTTSGITVHLAAGTVTGDATVGTDTLRSVEAIRGTNFADTYDATGFSATSTNAGSLGTFNNFDGQGGNDTIIGNGNTRIQYSNSAAAVTVDIAAGTAHGTAAGDVAQVGTDTFSGVNAVMGSVFDDTLLGSNITTATETFMGLAGNDFIDGRGGFDVALYSNLTYTTGAISVDMASGTVTGDASNGTDTLRSIEGVQGTIFNDTYVATNFGAAGFLITATNNVGNNGNFNQFEGLAGNDSITGNGNTRVIYSSAGGGVTVNLQAGTATGDASVGTDTYVGVNSATGSAFNDTYNAAGFTGITSAGSFGTFNLFEGLAGNDTITGNGNTRIAYSQAAGAVTVDLSGATGTAHGTAAGDVANVGTDTITGGVNSVQGSNFADLLIGGSAGETFIGGAGNDTINGGGGNDNITGGANNDTIDGGTGTDVAVFSGPRGSYTFSGIGTATVTVTDTRNASATVTPDGTDTLTNVEVLQFSDQLLLSASGTAINPVDVSALSFPAGPLTGTAGDDDLTIGVSMFNRAIDLGAGNNTVTIGAGSGTLNLTNVQHLVGSVNNNFVAMANDVNGMTIDLGAGSDTVNLANGVNSVSVTNVENLDGSDFTIGGVTSNDTLTILNNVSGITVNLGLGVNTLNLAAGANSFDNLFGVNTIHGSDSNDTLSDSSLGGVGTINNDMVIDLGAGDDTLIINGNYDNFALLNTEHLVGGAQDNYVVLNADVTGLTVDLGGGNNTLDLAGGINSVSVTNVQNIDTQDGIIANPASNDTLTLLNDVSGLTVNLQQGTNTLNLAAGTNALTTYNIQTINGSATGDSLTLLNSNYGVTIDLGGGTDTLTLSNNSNDVTVRNIENVIGGDGNDNINIADMTGTVTVTGGLGNDSITLGGSHDNIRFTEVADSGTNSGTDTVTNFDVANDAFVFDHVGGLASGIHFVSGGVLEGTAGNPQSEAFLNGNLLEIDVDGDGHIGAGDMLVYINGINGTLTDANFVTTGVDHRPTDIQLSGATVAENSSNGFVVGSLTATDPDAGDSATFSLTDNAGGLFAISGNNLVVNGPINYEAAQPLQVTVRVTDSGGLSYDKTFVIGVTDVNEAPTAVVLSNQIVFALENGGDVKVADIAITDDALGNNTLSLSGADAASFKIVNGNELHFVGGANFEAKAFYDVTVNANDASASNHVAPDASQSFHLIITDVNEAPTITSGATANVAENAPITTVVYQALASDQDVIPPNNIITWSLTGTDAAAFSISPTGQVTLNASANYEVKNSYSINVVATDGGALFDSKAVTIGIIDVNEAPTAVVLSGQVTSTTENGGDVKVANIAITDDALGSNVLSLSGADAASFTIVNGNELHFVGGANFEAKTGYDVTVNVNDAGASNHVAPDASQNFHLAITNVNEAPTDISLSNNTIGQSTANGTVIGVLSTVDPDAGDTATFSFVSNPGNQFGISGGNLVVAGALTAGAQQIIVRDTDSGGLSFDKTLTINVSSGATIVGDANANTLVGTAGDDLIQGLAGNDRLQGMAGNDTLDGGVGFDRAVYSEATGGITANLAAGTVSGPGVGTDMLINIEGIVGSAFADNLTAAGFAGDSGVVGTNVGFNEIEGGAGDDTITGATNSQGAPLTRISYVNASSAVTVNLAAHTATGGDGNDNLVGSGFSGIVGSRFDDTLTGTNNGPGTVEVFEGRAGNDTLNGAGGFDRADYALDPTTTSGITVNMVAGTVVGDRQAVGDTTVGSDTLVSIEAVRGTNFADSYTATGFSGSGVNPGNNGTFNEFNGMGGNDIIVGNGNTRIAFVNAVAAVTVDMQTSTTPETGTAVGDLVSTGSDSFSGVNAVMGSMFDDTIRGSNITTSTETFTGLAGNDLIDGRGGFDIASYNNIYFSTGPVTVNMGAGTATGDASIGSDTLLSIEAIQGTNFNDVYNASTYGTNAALNIGNNGTFNQFEGLGGNDTITGNSNTRIGYFNATAGVTVNIATGTATGDTSVGTDTFTGVNSVTGSAFSDTIIGDGNSNTLTGGGSNDTIDGGSGADLALFTGAKGGYTISLNTPSAGQVQVQDGTANRDGMDTLTNIEVLQFSDQSDLIASGSSGSPIDLSDNRLFFGATTNQFNVLTGSNNDFVKIGFSLSGHVINLGAGTGDTVILGQTGSYNLNLVNVENVVGSSGDDSINLTNIASGLSIDLGNGNDTVNLAVGTNSLSVAHVEQLNSTDFSGIASNDTLNLLNDVSGITVNLAQGDNTLNLAAGSNSFTNIFNVQHIHGTALDDTLTITGGIFEPGNNPAVDLGAGNNTLNVVGGNLSLLNVQHLNGDGSDNFVTLNNDVSGLAVDLGGGTNDNLNLAVGNNSLSVTNVENVSSSDWSGAASDDTLTLLSTVTGGVTINLQQGSNTLNLAAGSNTFDNLWNIDHVNGTSSNDTLTIQGGGAGAAIDLGDGNDTLNLNGGSFGVTISNVETINGSAFSDNFTISNVVTGSTTVTAGAGADAITASAGQDNFRFASVADSTINGQTDTIVNFDAVHDTFTFAGIAVTGGSIDYVGAGAFEIGHASATLQNVGPGNDVLNIDIDGNGVMDSADMVISLTNLQGPLHSSNFLLA